MSNDIDHSRRRILAGLAVATTFSILSPFARSAGVDYPFTLGVASSDPLPDGFVIWARLAPLFNAADGRQYRSEQPCILANGSHQGHIVTDLRVISDPRDLAATVSTLRSVVVEPGRAGTIAV